MENGDEIHLVGFVKLKTMAIIELIYAFFLHLKNKNATWPLCHIEY